MKNTFKVILLLMVLWLITTPSVHAQPLNLDDFDYPTTAVSFTSNVAAPDAYTTIDAPGIMGGERDIHLQHTHGNNNVMTGVSWPGGLLAYGEDAQTKGNLTITWDGNDNNPYAVAYRGLGGVNLASKKDSFLVAFASVDNGFYIKMRVWTNKLNWSESTRYVPVSALGQVIDLPFANFTIGSGANGPANFFNVGVIELEINKVSSVANLDIALAYINVGYSFDYMDFGDLPSSYKTTLAENGPRHAVGNVWLGKSVDTESNGFPSLMALSDDNNQVVNDEAGIVQVGTWGATGQIEAWVNSPYGRACLAGWIDFNGDGDFGDVGENLFYEANHLGTGEPSNMRELISGNNNLSFPIPPNSQSFYYARFRLVPDTWNDGYCWLDEAANGDLPSYGLLVDGEVEDYVLKP